MSRCEKASAVEDQNCGPAALLSAGGCKYDDVTQVSKPAVSPTSQSSDRPLSGRLRIWKSARQQVWKPALQNTSPNLRPEALSSPYAINEAVRNLVKLPASATAEWVRLRPKLIVDLGLGWIGAHLNF